MTSPLHPDEVLTRDLSSGRIHRRIRIGDQLASLEADNLDQAGAYEVVTADVLADVEPGGLCERCFPPIGGENAPEWLHPQDEGYPHDEVA